MPDSPAGGILVDKPAGPTSHDVVARARRALGLRRIGHTGTLDPFASGLLVLLVGRATRLAQFMADLPKGYVARARLGVTTTTLDPEGEVEAEDPGWERLGPTDVEAALRGFVGEISQVPPAFSAKKVRGEAAYRRARRGEGVELAPARVRIHALELEAVDLPHVTFRVRCSTGTYVRALARDLGEALGVGAHLVELRRTSIGDFRVEDALPGGALERLEPGTFGEVLARHPSAWHEPLALLPHLPRIPVGPDEARRLAAGQTLVPAGTPGAAADAAASGGSPGPVAVTLGERLVAVAGWEGRQLRPRKVFLDG